MSHYWPVALLALAAAPVVILVAIYAVSFPIDFARGFATGTGALLIVALSLEHIGSGKFSWSDLAHNSMLLGGTVGGVVVAVKAFQRGPSWWQTWRIGRSDRK